MGNRLSKIYTRTGDDGTTGLASGKRLKKSDLIFALMGDVDELNSNLGLAISFFKHRTDKDILIDLQPADFDIDKSLTIVQHLLFNLGGDLAMRGSEHQYEGITTQHIIWLENQIDFMNKSLLPLKEFILPGGSELMSQLHICRTVCRRCERLAVKLKEENEPAISDTSCKFLNRLSDWLFVITRYIAFVTKEKEILWNNEILNDIDANY